MSTPIDSPGPDPRKDLTPWRTRHAVLFKIQDATLATTKLSKIAGATAAPESAASLRCQNRQRLNPSLSMNPASGRSNWQTANPTDLPNLVKWTKKSPPIQPSGNASARAGAWLAPSRAGRRTHWFSAPRAALSAPGGDGSPGCDTPSLAGSANPFCGPNFSAAG